MSGAALARAQAAHAAGELDGAAALYREAAGAAPLEAGTGLARIALQRGEPAAALALLAPLLEAHPDAAALYATQAAALLAAGRVEAAVEAYEDTLALDPGLAEARYGLGAALHVLGRLEDAAASYRRALGLDPDYAEAAYGLGVVEQALGRPAEAAAMFACALDIDPSYVEARLGRAAALHASGSAEDAAAEYRRVLDEDPAHEGASVGLSAALTVAGRHAEALAALDGASPGGAALERQRGLILAELGRLDEASAAFAASLAAAPQGAVYRELANCRRLAPGSPHIAAMQDLAARADALSAEERTHLHFALGRALTDTGEPAAGFAHFLRANALHRPRVRYDEAATLRLLARIAASFPPALFAHDAMSRAGERAPIFIVGMPRSGSTLIEQILASHPDVVAGGERPDFGAAVRAAGIDTEDAPYPESVASLDAAALAALGDAYRARVAVPPGRVPTDKMLANALFVGLIHLALPDARIVHARRDAVDTCLSCFAELFVNDVPFAYDLGELGRFSRAHTALMDHWRAVLPEGVMLDVDYERLVAEPEAGARLLLAHCGLSWDPAVLRFHERRNPVRTASLAQVREPIHARSVGRWRPDEAALRPLLQALAGQS